jgi:hypothetical protein
MKPKFSIIVMISIMVLMNLTLIRCLIEETNVIEEEMLLSELSNLKLKSKSLEFRLNGKNNLILKKLYIGCRNNAKSIMSKPSFLEVKSTSEMKSQLFERNMIKADPFFKSMNGGFSIPTSRSWTGEAKRGKYPK